MTRTLRDMVGFDVVGADGELGTVVDVYFDDDSWIVRYLVVSPADIGRETPFLASPIAVAAVGEDSIKLDLSRDGAARAPEIEADQPVSRLLERTYSDHFGWYYYWMGGHPWGRWSTPIGLGTAGPGAAGPGPTGPHTVPPLEGTDAPEQARARGDEPPEGTEPQTTLRSVSEVGGYHVQAVDDEIGHVEDFLVDEESWRIHCLVVDTSNWWFGKKVTVAVERCSHIDWTDQKIFVEETREAVKESAEYDEDHPACGHEAA
jgi:uncharacterized protein YrrD